MLFGIDSTNRLVHIFGTPRATVESHIAASHPHKQEIESAVRELLDSIADRWLVRIEPARTMRWWMVTMTRTTDGQGEAFFVDPAEQTAEFVTAAIRRMIDDAQ